MGRPPLRAGHAERAGASDYAKQRLRWILATLSGEATVQEASTALGIGESRFHELRERAVAGAAVSLEPRPRGRPPKLSGEPSEREQELLAKVAALEEEVIIERTRAELAVGLPHLLDPERSGGRGEKRARGTGGRGRASGARRRPRGDRDP